MRESLKCLCSMAMLAGAFSALMFASGCTDPSENSCAFDDECATGEVCDTQAGVCVAPGGGTACASSAECSDGFCVADADNAGSGVCVAMADCNDVIDEDKNSVCAADEVCNADGCGMAPDCSTEEDPAAFCANELGLMEGETATCEEGVCEKEEIPSTFRYILVSDLSVDGCTDMNAGGEFDPGSDIMYVELLDAEGQTVAWGANVEYNQADDPQNDYNDPNVLDGMAPSLIMDGSEDDGCPDGDDRFNAMTVVSLGCGGSVLVGFDAPIYNGYTVRVGEYAPICNQNMGGSPTGTTDKYEVKLCPATEEGTAATIAGCLVDGTDIHPNTDGGIKQCTVTGAGAAE